MQTYSTWKSILWGTHLILIGILFSTNAQAANGDPFSPVPTLKKIKMDSLAVWMGVFEDAEKEQNTSATTVADLANMIEENVGDRKSKRTMLHFLRRLRVNRAFRNEKVKAKLYDEMATISAKMKLYPLAMQFCYQELKSNNDNSSALTETLPDSSYNLSELDTVFHYREKKVTDDMEPVTADDILQSFDDHKEATNYALMVHVKQPLKGRRKAFTGIDNVGHMFITLIKYNADKTFVSRTFGFYPNKNNFLSATPLRPSSTSTLKDDARHDWDETVGKFISYRRFTKIIKVLTKYQYKPYDLNENNCTDFGLSIATLTGIQINETSGKWPMGKGNNPANAGQSMLEDKVSVNSSEELPKFFVFKNE